MSVPSRAHPELMWVLERWQYGGDDGAVAGPTHLQLRPELLCTREISTSLAIAMINVCQSCNSLGQIITVRFISHCTSLHAVVISRAA